MKKIGIITINDFNNYGNRLQCYATQEILKKMGVEPENIFNMKQTPSVKSIIKKRIKQILKYKGADIEYRREANFNEFNKNIIFSKFKIINNKYDERINDYYDNFLVGSDQVWNPEFETTIDASFLKFVKNNKKKNSFAASFGISKLPTENIQKYKERISEFNNISVREEAGKDIINKQLNIKKDVQVLIDPTMLLSIDEWNLIAMKPKNIKKDKKYILNYFLGKLSNERKKEIEKVAKDNNCKIINILDKNDPFYISGPSEFLWLEAHAFLICTDSFHSAVFAILNQKPFIVFEREDVSYKSMNSRLETLLKKFKMEDRYYDGKITNKYLISNYREAFEILEKEKKKSREYLEKVLGD